MNRRNFIRKSLLATAGISTLTGLYTWQLEPYWLEFVHTQMDVPHLPSELEGKTLMQISDVHVSNRFDYNYLIESFQKAQSLRPDFVVYTGDYVSWESTEQLEQLRKVFAHTVRGKLGTFGILGNHDYGEEWSEQWVADTITQVLESNGIVMLSNEIQEKNGLHFLGIDDVWGLNFDPEKVLRQHNPKDATVALCHNPDVCDLDVWADFQSWILAGHTHGGQCKPPFLPAPMLPVENKRYSAGKISLTGNRTLYINRALGTLYPVRFNVRPEITVFTLQKQV